MVESGGLENRCSCKGSGGSNPPLSVTFTESGNFGEMSEWLKVHAWKACMLKSIGGSNPPLSVTREKIRLKARELRLFRNVRGYARSVFQTPSDSEESSGRKIVLVP